MTSTTSPPAPPRPLDALRWGLSAWVAVGLAVGACTDNRVVDDGSADTDPTGTGTSTTTGPVPTTTLDTTSTDGVDETGTTGADESSTGDDGECGPGNPCAVVDLLFVIDNSGTMGEEQLNLARNFELLADELDDLGVDADGTDRGEDVHIMVTTTDMGHPLCTAFQPPGYEPRLGAPVYTGCNSRIERFTGLDPFDPVVIPEACTESCPVDVAPDGHFIHTTSTGSNVPDDDVGTALACIGPQGIDGCGFEAPLEAMLQAINTSACWNSPEQEACDQDPEWADVTAGFMREEATLAIVLVTDELDCSVLAPSGYTYFTDPANDVYWNVNPETGVPQATSAVCFNAGVTCTDVEGDGLYESCESSDTGALHPTARYIDYLGYLRSTGKEVIMMNLLGVPEVTMHDPDPPYEPTGGGVHDLLYRSWVDFPYPNGDILPDEWASGITAANKIFELGALGPGCTGTDLMGNFTGQALPPVRIREVCESLNGTDDEGEPIVRCCIESICDTDFSPAIRCLTGSITQGPAGV